MSARAALLAVAAAWLWVLIAYAPGADLSRDDLCYLTTLHDFLRGFEARKDYGHVGWGLLHTVGHLPLRSWADGHVGAVLTWFGTTIVPFCAWVAYRLGESVLRDRRAAALAAALAAWSPAVVMGASTLGFWSRAGSVGFALLGVAKLLDALRSGRRRDAAAAVFLQGVGFALHPWALTGPAIAAPLLLFEVYGPLRRGRRGPAMMLGAVLALDALLLVAVLGSGQEHRTAAGARNLLPSLLFMPQVAAAHGAWQLPGVGRLLPMVPGPLAAALGMAGIGGLLASARTRAAGLLLLGGLVAALPEAAAPFPPLDWRAAWTGNFVKACVGMELAVPVAVAAGVVGLRREWLMTALLLVSAGRAVPLALDKAEVAARDADAGRAVGRLLAGSSTIQALPTVVGSLAPMTAASFEGKYNPELPRRSSMRHGGKGAAPTDEYGGLDLAMWRTSTMRCELAMGWSRDDGIVPEDPDASHRSLCSRTPLVLPSRRASGRACVVWADGEVPRFACPPPPPHAPAGASRDPVALPLAALGLLLLGVGLPWSRGARPGGSGDHEGRSTVSA